MCLRSAAPKFFWEEGWLSEVFAKKADKGPVSGSDVAGMDSRPVFGGDPHHGEAEEEASAAKQVKRVFMSVGSSVYAKVLVCRPEREIVDKWSQLCEDWAAIVSIDIEAFAFGRMLLEQEGDRVGHSTLVESLKAALGVKAQSTVEKRLGSMRGYVKWAMQQGVQIFPLNEFILYKYLQQVAVDRESGKAGATTGKSFVEAIHFSASMLGHCADTYTLKSPRIGGLATQMARTAPPILQSDPLTVRQVIALERFAMQAPSMQDRCLAVQLWSWSTHAGAALTRGELSTCS